MAKIPVVDFSNLECMKPGTSSWHSIRKQVCNALQEFCCFTATMSNKFTWELHNTFFASINDLYKAPDEIKAQNKYKNCPFCGHFKGSATYEGLGIYDPTNPDETSKFSHLFWEDGNEQFCDAIRLYANALKELNQVVTRMVFENYGAEKYHDGHIDSSFYCFQFVKYLEPEKAGTNVGLGRHTDKTFTSILHQNLKGLEICTKDGEWIGFDPHPPPSSFLFIASDLLQVWSNDRIKACAHRVHQSHSDQIRYSFGLFELKKGVTSIPEELVDTANPLKYKPLNQAEYLEFVKTQVQKGAGQVCHIKAFCGIGNSYQT